MKSLQEIQMLIPMKEAILEHSLADLFVMTVTVFYRKGLWTPALATLSSFPTPLKESAPVPTSGPLLLLCSVLGMPLYDLCSNIIPSFCVHICSGMLIMLIVSTTQGVSFFLCLFHCFSYLGVSSWREQFWLAHHLKSAWCTLGTL